MQDITGKRSGFLEVISFSHYKNKRYYWNCKCHRCGKDHTVRHDKIIHQLTKTCGCIRHHKWEDIKKLIENITPNENGCKIWPSFIEKKVKIEGKKLSAHRASYKIFKGELLPDGCICHSCDNPSCVNPDHLFQGDRFINAHDAMEKGRNTRGEKHPNHIVTDKIVLEIRKAHEQFLKDTIITHIVRSIVDKKN